MFGTLFNSAAAEVSKDKVTAATNFSNVVCRSIALDDAAFDAVATHL